VRNRARGKPDTPTMLTHDAAGVAIAATNVVTTRPDVAGPG
jgi:hypothetical protein